MAENARRKLVVLEDSTLASMALNDAIVKEFPFLAPLGRVVRGGGSRQGGCGSCGRAAQEKANIFASAKQTIAGMASDRKRRLKELLHAEQARVTFRNNSGKIVQLTF
jgi:hypothetical protein